jgi:hypothetical protein
MRTPFYLLFLSYWCNHLKGEWHTGTETYQNQHNCAIGRYYNLLRNKDLAVLDWINPIEINDLAGFKDIVNKRT